ncbi:MAG: sigma-70 family RNA polymerase sigma factor [Propionibacteriales bacterium]|nr:sigma-70 family RNA polymerase sigma factor [Propionibacteriales bacterium]
MLRCRHRDRGGWPTEDAEAIARARDGDQDAYEVLVGRYTAPAHRTAYFLGAGDDAEDVVQEAFVKAYRALPRYRDGAPFRPWLLRIVANETKNAVRGRGRRERLALRALDAPPADDPVLHAVEEERRRALLECMRELAGKDREVVVCRYFVGLSEAETAAALGIARGTVKSRTSRALSRLRTRLEDASMSCQAAVVVGLARCAVVSVR